MDPAVVRSAVSADHRPFVANPIAVAAILVLLANDHILKAVAPGFLAGKLSDVAGLLFFPLLLADAALLVSAITRPGRRLAPRRVVRVSALATAGVFAVAKTTAWGAGLVGLGLAAAQWPILALASSPRPLAPVPIAVDPTDLLTLPAVLIAIWIARDRAPVIRGTSSRSGRRAVSAGIALLAGVSCLATSQTAPNGPSSALTSQPMTLTAAQASQAWHVSWTTTKTTGATLAIYASKSGGDAHPADDWPPGVVLAFVQDDTAQTGTHGEADISAFRPIVLPACSDTCQGGAGVTIIVTGAVPDNGLTLHLVAQIEGSGSVSDGMRVSISIDPQPSSSG